MVSEQGHEKSRLDYKKYFQYFLQYKAIDSLVHYAILLSNLLDLGLNTI